MNRILEPTYLRLSTPGDVYCPSGDVLARTPSSIGVYPDSYRAVLRELEVIQNDRGCVRGVLAAHDRAVADEQEVESPDWAGQVCGGLICGSPVLPLGACSTGEFVVAVVVAALLLGGTLLGIKLWKARRESRGSISYVVNLMVGDLHPEQRRAILAVKEMILNYRPKTPAGEVALQIERKLGYVGKKDFREARSRLRKLTSDFAARFGKLSREVIMQREPRYLSMDLREQVEMASASADQPSVLRGKYHAMCADVAMDFAAEAYPEWNDPNRGEYPRLFTNYLLNREGEFSTDGPCVPRAVLNAQLLGSVGVHLSAVSLPGHLALFDPHSNLIIDFLGSGVALYTLKAYRECGLISPLHEASPQQLFVGLIGNIVERERDRGGNIASRALGALRLSVSPNDPTSYNVLAAVVTSSGLQKKLFDAALELCPTNYETVAYLGIWHYFNGEPLKGISYLQSGLEMARETCMKCPELLGETSIMQDVLNTTALIAERLAICCLEQGLTEGAAKALATVLAINPKSHEALLLAADVYRHIGGLEMVEKGLQIIYHLLVDPETPRLCRARAHVMFAVIERDRGNPRMAEVQFQKAREIEPNILKMMKLDQ